MSRFAPETWEVRPLEDFDLLADTLHPEADYSLLPLLVVEPAPGDVGNYRFLLAGKEHLTIKVAIDAMLDVEAFKGMYVETQLQLGGQVNVPA